MPYQIRGYPKKTYKSKQSKNTSVVAKTALRKVNRLINQTELKHHDTTITDATLAAAGNVWTISGITQGSTELTMVGDKCRITSALLGLHWSATTPANQDYHIRFILAYFKDSDDGSALLNLLKESTVHSLYSVSGRDNSKILFDKTVKVNSNVASQFDDGVLRIKVPVQRIHSESNKSADGMVRLFVLHNNTDEQIALDGDARVFFKDMV